MPAKNARASQGTKVTKARGGKKVGTSVTGASRAGLLFAPARCQRHLREGRFSTRVGSSAGVFMAGVLEYLTAEVLELAVDVAADMKNKTLQPKHLNLAFRGDQELGQLMHHATFTASSVPVVTHPFLLAGKAAKDLKAGQASQQV